MQIATWLFVASTLVSPAPAPAPTTLVIHSATTASHPAASFAGGQQRATVAPIGGITGPSNRFGLGGALSVSNLGINGSVRYWVTKHVGVSMDAGWFRPYGYQTYNSVYGATAGITPSTMLASPSVMVRFGTTDPNRAVSFRPYAGGGVTYAHATSVIQTTATSSAFSRSLTTSHEFAGAEMFFRDHPNLALNFEGIHTDLPGVFASRQSLTRTTFVVGATFYLR